MIKIATHSSFRWDIMRRQDEQVVIHCDNVTRWSIVRTNVRFCSWCPTAVGSGYHQADAVSTDFKKPSMSWQRKESGTNRVRCWQSCRRDALSLHLFSSPPTSKHLLPATMTEIKIRANVKGYILNASESQRQHSCWRGLMIHSLHKKHSVFSESTDRCVCLKFWFTVFKHQVK